MVVCPGQVYYLDMANSPAWSEPGAGWAGWSDPEKLYRFDPVEGWTDARSAISWVCSPASGPSR